jgi:hypothetical protein
MDAQTYSVTVGIIKTDIYKTNAKIEALNQYKYDIQQIAERMEGELFSLGKQRTMLYDQLEKLRQEYYK